MASVDELFDPDVVDAEEPGEASEEADPEVIDVADGQDVDKEEDCEPRRIAAVWGIY